jgi:hypothetical protein
MRLESYRNCRFTARLSGAGDKRIAARPKKMRPKEVGAIAIIGNLQFGLIGRHRVLVPFQADARRVGNVQQAIPDLEGWPTSA